MIIRAPTNERDLQARIEKAGGPAAWSEKLKMQREVCHINDIYAHFIQLYIGKASRVYRKGEWQSGESSIPLNAIGHS
jgi:hypothetical protein